ncbi:hypothetical protein M8C21_010294, partial [Ambrosia artemisiifolia]
MAASSVSVSIFPPTTSTSISTQSVSVSTTSLLILPYKFRTCGFHLRASPRRPPPPPPSHQEAGEKNRMRNWNPNRMTFYDEEEEDDDEEEEEEDEDDRSLDLLIKFVENVFKKISKRARKSVRSVLPVNIPTKLVGFSVNGVIILAFFWILKAFLEVVCTLGSVVFVSILLVRGVWTGISYFQQGSS